MLTNKTVSPIHVQYTVTAKHVTVMYHAPLHRHVSTQSYQTGGLYNLLIFSYKETASLLSDIFNSCYLST